MAAPSLALIPSAYKVGKVASVKPINGKGDFTFTRNSEATRINENGIIETMGVDVPRIDHTDGGCPSLLLEPASTNLITYSEDFSNASWAKGSAGIASTPIITSNYQTSPTGNQDADRIQASLNGGIVIGDRSYIQFTNIGVSNTSNSVYLKSNTGVNQTIYLRVSSIVTAIVVTTEWVRYPVIASGSTDYFQIGIRGADYGGLTSTDTIDLGIWGAQREQLPYATSYIPTSGTAVTRAAEVCNGAGDASTFNSAEGVLFIESSLLIDDDSNKYISLTDTADENKVQIDFDYSSSRIQYVVISDSVVYCNIKLTYVGTNTDKIAVKWKVNDFAIWINGVEVGTDTSGSAPISLDTLKFSSSSGGNNFEGNVKQLQVFKTALTDAELIALTSWSSFTEMATALKYSIQ